jgi:trehalose 6-phosphate phosphatase
MSGPLFLPPPPLSPGLGPIADAALFLDFDGTLVEIAPRPDAVQVQPGLPRLLQRLATGLNGALAIVSGRPLRDLDHFLPVPIAKVGDHGATLRPVPDGPPESPELPHSAPEWRERAASLVERFPGALIEDKEHGFVVHFRLAPAAGPVAKTLLDEMLAESPGGAAFTVLEARMAWEVRPRGASKGTAVRSLMGRAPFAGRRPVFIGDDVTDEEGMAAAREHGGLGLRLQDCFGEPEALRDWLARSAPAPAAGEEGEAPA